MFAANCSINHALNLIGRQVHSCPVFCSTMKKQAKIMAKLLTGSHRKSRNWYVAEMMAKSPILSEKKNFQEGFQGKRRVDVLNKLFMRHITDLLAMGDVTDDIIGRGISITRVKVTTDFSAINLYWTSSAAVRDPELDKILETTAFELRHQLCQLHLMGTVPKVCFIADKWQNIINETEQLMDIIREKDGYIEANNAENLKSECTLEAPIEPEILAKINELEENVEDPVPPMTHNVLGLDHATIMTRIQMSVLRSEARHRRNLQTDERITYSEYNSGKTVVNNYGIRPSDITRYIAKQRIQKKKAERALREELLAEMELYNNPKEEEYIVREDNDTDFIEEFEKIVENNLELEEK